MNYFIKGFLTYFLLPLAVAVLAFFIGKWWEKKEAAVGFIDYRVMPSTNLLGEISGQADLSIDRRKVGNIGYIEVEVFNKTSRDFKDFKLDMVVKSRNQNLKIHNVDYWDVNKRKDRVNVNFRTPPTDTLNRENVLSFIINTMNRADEPVLTAKLVVEDIETVECFVLANYEPGFEARASNVELNAGLIAREPLSEQLYIMVLTLVVVTFGLCIITIASIVRKIIIRQKNSVTNPRNIAAMRLAFAEYLEEMNYKPVVKAKVLPHQQPIKPKKPSVFDDDPEVG